MQSDMIRVIVIDGSDSDAEIVLNQLRKARYSICPRYIADDKGLQEALIAQEWDLILCAEKVGEFSATQVCNLVSSFKQDLPVIVLVETLDCKSLAGLLKAGAKQVIFNDNGGCLPVVVGQELANLSERRQRKYLEHLYKESQRHNKMLL